MIHIRLTFAFYIYVIFTSLGLTDLFFGDRNTQQQRSPYRVFPFKIGSQELLHYSIPLVQVVNKLKQELRECESVFVYLTVRTNQAQDWLIRLEDGLFINFPIQQHAIQNHIRPMRILPPVIPCGYIVTRNVCRSWNVENSISFMIGIRIYMWISCFMVFFVSCKIQDSFHHVHPFFFMSCNIAIQHPCNHTSWKQIGCFLFFLNKWPIDDFDL